MRLLQVKVFCQEVSIYLHGFPIKYKQTPGTYDCQTSPFPSNHPLEHHHHAPSLLSFPSALFHSHGELPLCCSNIHTMQPIKLGLPSSQPGSLNVKPLLDLKASSKFTFVSLRQFFGVPGWGTFIPFIPVTVAAMLCDKALIMRLPAGTFSK